MASSGADHKVKIWDLRMYKELHQYTHERPIDEMSVSDTGLLALGFGGHVKVHLRASLSAVRCTRLTNDVGLERCT